MPQLAIGAGVTSTPAYLLYREALSAILIGMPEFTTTYDIDPHAGDAGFDDAANGVVPSMWHALPIVLALDYRSGTGLGYAAHGYKAGGRSIAVTRRV